MEGINLKVPCHKLNINLKAKHVWQKWRPLDVERYAALKEEIDRLQANNFIRESFYPDWLTYLVLVRKLNGKWRTYVDFTNLDKACPKNSFLLPRINQLVDATASHELFSFMDTYSGNNQIPMYTPDEEHTSFVTDRGLFCYRLMPFGLVNIGTSYQRLVSKMFTQKIGRSMEVEDHIGHLNKAFEILCAYKMKLNSLRCAFGVASRKLLGFMVNERGIEANLEKIQALLEMHSLGTPKKVQRLIWRVAALSNFIARAIEICVPFFDVLRRAKRFEWSPQCEEAFKELKEHLKEPLLLSKPVDNEVLYLYLAVFKHVVSFVLIREENGVQLLVYYVSKHLLNAEIRYSDMRKLAYALIINSRKLRPYFHTYTIHLLTVYPLK